VEDQAEIDLVDGREEGEALGDPRGDSLGDPDGITEGDKLRAELGLVEG